MGLLYLVSQVLLKMMWCKRQTIACARPFSRSGRRPKDRPVWASLLASAKARGGLSSSDSADFWLASVDVGREVLVGPVSRRRYLAVCDALRHWRSAGLAVVGFPLLAALRPSGGALAKRSANEVVCASGRIGVVAYFIHSGMTARDSLHRHEPFERSTSCGGASL